MSATLLVFLTLGAAEPSPIPTGMELLYGDRVPIRPDGEPSIAVGIMQGQKSITLTVGRSQMDFFQDSVLRSATPRPGATLKFTLVRSKPAERRHYVDVDGVAFNAPRALNAALKRWTARGYEVEVQEQGTGLGVGGRFIDTRILRIVLPAKSRAAAQSLAQRVHEETGVRAMVSSRLETLPWAEFRVDIDGAPVGIATSYTRIAALGSETLTVRQVGFGENFSHSGREDRRYHGELYVVVDADGALAIVNVLGAEDLLKGVVPSELFASAHPSALRAQSVAARNQLFAKLGHRHHSEPFHLCDEQHCQVYTGVNREDPRTNAAIDATRGELLFHRDTLVDTVYSSTCGGHTEDNDAVWGRSADPALRGRPDFHVHRHPELASYADGVSEREMPGWVAHAPVAYCSSASKAAKKKFRWTKRFSPAQLDALVAKRFPDVGHVRSVTIKGRGPGGRVKRLDIVGTRGRAHLLHELPIRRLFAHLNSGAFVVERDAEGGFVFRGGGWGHGVGMCQLGAIGRAEEGHGYARILEHYYNGARTERVYGPQVSWSSPESD
ncbi:MAG: SpoIID/LytB domain-containing protein [Myxococcota bacterium]